MKHKTSAAAPCCGWTQLTRCGNQTDLQHTRTSHVLQTGRKPMLHFLGRDNKGQSSLCHQQELVLSPDLQTTSSSETLLCCWFVFVTSQMDSPFLTPLSSLQPPHPSGDWVWSWLVTMAIAAGAQELKREDWWRTVDGERRGVIPRQRVWVCGGDAGRGSGGEDTQLCSCVLRRGPQVCLDEINEIIYRELLLLCCLCVSKHTTCSRFQSSALGQKDAPRVLRDLWSELWRGWWW